MDTKRSHSQWAKRSSLTQLAFQIGVTAIKTIGENITSVMMLAKHSMIYTTQITNSTRNSMITGEK